MLTFGKSSTLPTVLMKLRTEKDVIITEDLSDLIDQGMKFIFLAQGRSKALVTCVSSDVVILNCWILDLEALKRVKSSSQLLPRALQMIKLQFRSWMTMPLMIRPWMTKPLVISPRSAAFAAVSEGQCMRI